MRIGPIFALAPPFTLMRLPMLFRTLLVLALAMTLASADPGRLVQNTGIGSLIAAAVCELLLGLLFALSLQVCFAGLQMAGRLVDIQAGFGLASVIDPTSHAQAPLIGSLFAYAAGALFFSADGHLELLRIMNASINAIPIGAWRLPASPERLTAYMSTIFVLAIGVAGAAILTLLLVDLVIALLARTVPQMNVLILGFQVKTLVILTVLPLCFGMGGAIMLRLVRVALDSVGQMV
jgi:flagellar biosynthetic protein FliR